MRYEYERIVADIEGEGASYYLWSRPDILCKPKFTEQKDSDVVTPYFEQSEENLIEPGVDTSELSRSQLASEETENKVQCERKEIEVQTEPQPSPHFPGAVQRDEKFETREAEVQTELPQLAPPLEKQPDPHMSECPDTHHDPPVFMETYLGTLQQPAMELPKDKEALLELRAKVAMELMWVNQAITSRQKVSHMGASVTHTIWFPSF